MSKLNDIKGEIFAYCKGKAIIYQLDGGIDFTNKVAISSTEDWKDFLKIGESLKIDVVYYSESYGDDEHSGELESIEIGFVHNNILHKFEQFADWYEDTESSEEEDTKNVEEFIKENPEEISKQILDYAKENNYNLNELNDYEIQSLGREFLEESDIFLSGLPQMLRIQIENKLKNAISIIMKNKMIEVLHREEEMMPKLIEDGVKWAEENSLTKVNKTNIQTFLTLNDVALSSVNTDKLYLLVNQKLKNRKNERS